MKLSAQTVDHIQTIYQTVQAMESMASVYKQKVVQLVESEIGIKLDESYTLDMTTGEVVKAEEKGDVSSVAPAD